MVIFAITDTKVIEVGHDFTMQIKKWCDSKGIKNSFDTWHGKIGMVDIIFPFISLVVMFNK